MISDESLPKTARLLKSKDFRGIYKKGRSVKRGVFILCYLPNGLGDNRLGFSIGSRNIKLATRRNRLKRLFKEVYRRRKDALNKGFDLVIIIKKDPGKAVAYSDTETVFMELIKGTRLAA